MRERRGERGRTFLCQKPKDRKEIELNKGLKRNACCELYYSLFLENVVATCKVFYSVA